MALLTGSKQYAKQKEKQKYSVIILVERRPLYFEVFFREIE